ncbi:MAG: RagB/SusD family nutrient uptake outer membrane protein [Flavobacterium sp.]
MKRVKILVGLLFLATATVGCSDFLSEAPDNRTQIDTPKKVGELLVGAYPEGSHVEFAEQMSDNVVDNGKLDLTTLQSEQNFTWAVSTEDNADSPKKFWMASYAAIASANKALEALEGMQKEYANKPLKVGLKQLRAEALLARAYNHFMLVNLWAKSYDATTAESDLGVPYVTTVEDVLKKDYKRNSVAEVYKLIEQDLLEGLEGIKGATYESPSIAKYHFTEASAKAFATRFYLFKGDYAKAIEYSNDLGNLPINKLRNVVRSAAWDTAKNEREFAKTEYETNLLVVTSYSRKGRTNHTSRFVLTSGAATRGNGLFSEASHPFKADWIYRTANYTLNDAYYVPKFYEHFKITDFTNMTGFTYVPFVLFSNDMLYLDRIEAFIMQNRVEEAFGMYEYFMWTRTKLADFGLPADTAPELLLGALRFSQLEEMFPYQAGKFTTSIAISEKQTIMLEALTEMRRRDGYEEGYRWFDIRRFKLEVIHQVVGGAQLVLKKGDLRYQLQVPQVAIDNGITPNPR